jgi:hypothetical protein
LLKDEPRLEAGWQGGQPRRTDANCRPVFLPLQTRTPMESVLTIMVWLAAFATFIYHRRGLLP